MTQKIYKEMILKTGKDYRGIASDVNKAMERLASLPYGIYTYDKKDRHILIMVENMGWFQETTNRGIRVIGEFSSSYRFEIYDYKKRQQELDDAMKMLGDYFM